MKPLYFSFTVLGFAAVLSFAGLRPALANDSTPDTSNSSDSGTSSNPNQDARREMMKKAFAQLDLTDAQKKQMAEIHQNVSDPAERRQQIMAVLTPDQKAKLAAMIKAHREANQSSSSSGTSQN